MLTWQKLLQEALLQLKILARVLPYIQDLKTGFTINIILPLQEALQWPNTLTRRFKRNTDTMPLVITCRAKKASFQDKEQEKITTC
jgi:hypothetical protein